MSPHHHLDHLEQRGICTFLGSNAHLHAAGRRGGGQPPSVRGEHQGRCGAWCGPERLHTLALSQVPHLDNAVLACSGQHQPGGVECNSTDRVGRVCRQSAHHCRWPAPHALAGARAVNFTRRSVHSPCTRSHTRTAPSAAPAATSSSAPSSAHAVTAASADDGTRSRYIHHRRSAWDGRCRRQAACGSASYHQRARNAHRVHLDVAVGAPDRRNRRRPTAQARRCHQPRPDIRLHDCALWVSEHSLCAPPPHRDAQVRAPCTTTSISEDRP
jgi:hypothetical protein